MMYVKELPDPEAVETIARSVFRKGDISVEDGMTKLRQSIEYYQTFNTSHKSVIPTGKLPAPFLI